ncbi:MAG: arginase family protein [bacterium]
MKKSQIAIIGLPYDEQSSLMKGAAKAPQMIREAFRSESTNKWSESGIDLGDESVLFDAGDVELQSADDAFGEIENAIAQLLDRDPYPISLARIMENGLVERLVQIGIRTTNNHKREQAERFGVEIIE